MRILVVEDEKNLNRIITEAMEDEGYSVDSCFNGADALDYALTAVYDVVILDIMLPKMDGLELVRRLRRSGNHTPVLFLTARDSVADRVEGLESGGDYYLTKPYSFDELIAVVSRLLTRHTKAEKKQVTITKGPITLDIAKNRALVNGKDAHLTAKEFALLLVLIENENKIFSPEELYEFVWGAPSADDTRTIRFHIGNLKRKIGTKNAEDYDIVSVYGKGYLFTSN